MPGSAPDLPARRPLAFLTLLLALLAHGHTPARAGDYPDRPVKIVVPFPAGGTADAIPRIVADWLSRKWGQPVVIENRTGAAGNIGAESSRLMSPKLPQLTPMQAKSMYRCNCLALPAVTH